MRLVECVSGVCVRSQETEGLPRQQRLVCVSGVCARSQEINEFPWQQCLVCISGVCARSQEIKGFPRQRQRLVAHALLQVLRLLIFWASSFKVHGHVAHRGLQLGPLGPRPAPPQHNSALPEAFAIIIFVVWSRRLCCCPGHHHRHGCVSSVAVVLSFWRWVAWRNFAVTLTYQGFAVCNLGLFATELCLWPRPSHHRGFSLWLWQRSAWKEGRTLEGFPWNYLTSVRMRKWLHWRLPPRVPEWRGRGSTPLLLQVCFLWREWVAEDIVEEKHVHTCGTCCGTWCKAV